MKIRTIIITAVLTLSMVAGMAGCAGGNGSVSGKRFGLFRWQWHQGFTDVW